jgi:hypothetical protein
VKEEYDQVNAGYDSDSPPRYRFKDKGGVRDAGKALCKYIDPQGLLDSNKGPRRPLVILSFDEAHLLTGLPQRPPSQHLDWTLFSELRQVLRELVDIPIFSLFLSTAGSANLFSPAIQSDPSSLVTNLQKLTLHPISEISFDDLAYPALESSVTLDRVVELDWISHIGRPLYVQSAYSFSVQLTSHPV